MYDKIYKEIFLKSFVTEKEKIFQFPKNENVSIWKVKISEKSYFITVYQDDIDSILDKEEKEQNIKDYEKRNEAELTHYITDFGENPTVDRIIANRRFLNFLINYSKELKKAKSKNFENV